MSNHSMTLDYVSKELVKGVKYLEDRLQYIIKNDNGNILGYTEEFYALFKLEHKLSYEFIEKVKKIELDDDWLFDDSHKLYYLYNMGLVEHDEFQHVLDVFIKQEQRRNGFIHSNSYNHVGPMRVLVNVEPESDYTKLAIEYFINNYNPQNYEENAIGILALFEYNYNKYEELLKKYVQDLKYHFKDNSYINSRYSTEKTTAIAIQAISNICGPNDRYVINGVKWIKSNQDIDGKFCEHDIGMGEILLSLISCGDGIKVPKEELKKMKMLNSQQKRRLNNIEGKSAYIAIDTEYNNCTNERKFDKSKVFIVHGHDNLAKTEVARFIEKLGMQPIILHEQASTGNTIIEKIEEYSNVGFGIVIYTPCDVGNRKDKKDNLNKRARQNVIFEHGYLIGKIGRKNVCALVKDEIEKPNDISGVVYIQMDEYNAWQMQIVKEMKQQGYEVDMNCLLK